MLIVFLMGGTDRRMNSLLRASGRWVALVVGIGLALAAVAGAYWRVAPVCRLVALASGHEIWMDQNSIEVGRIPAGSDIEVEAILRNFSGRSIDVIGAEVSCQCTAADKLPATMPANGKVIVPIHITVGASRDVINERVVLLLNDNGQIRRFPVSIHATVSTADAAPASGRSGDASHGTPDRDSARGQGFRPIDVSRPAARQFS